MIRVLLAGLLLVGVTGYSITEDVQLTHTDQAIFTIPAKAGPLVVDLNPKATASGVVGGPYEVGSATMGANLTLFNAIKLHRQAKQTKSKASFVVGYVVEDLESGKDTFFVVGANIPAPLPPKIGEEGFNPPESFPKIEIPEQGSKK